MPKSLDIHCIAIGGTGMAPLACLLQELGHRVRGSDRPLYPPMSTLLAEAGIVPRVGFEPGHLEPAPDLVVVGNAVPRDNPQAQDVDRRGLPRVSMPEALSRFLLAGRRPLVVAGTHGKTTTTSMAAWTYRELGADPGFLIGGVPLDLGRSFRLGTGERFVIEGDEYNAAYFDRGPKFLHYRPETLILTSVEHDHVDLYPTPESLRRVFAQLLEILPESGCLVACGDSPEVRDLVAAAPCPVLRYGFAEDCEVRARPAGDDGVARLEGPEGWRADLRLTVPGRHNLSNALAVWAAACRDGHDPQAAANALGRFRGVMRRLEVIGSAAGVTVIDDFAHHPTAVASSLQGVAQAFPGRRRVVLFEPRSLTAGRSFFHEAYQAAFGAADQVWFAPIFYAERLSASERLDLPRLCADLGVHGVTAQVAESLESLAREALATIRGGDVVVCMSSGAFDDMPRRLLGELRRGAEA